MMECSICGATFSRRGALIGHIKKHDAKVACSICGKMIHPSVLGQHSKIHGKDKLCLFCGKVIHATKNKVRNKFCSRACATKVNNPKRRKRPLFLNSGKCLHCGKEILRRNIYCSVECQSARRYQQYIADWLAGNVSGNVNGAMDLSISVHVRKWLIEKHGEQCEKCGWHSVNPYSGTVPLTVHHKDGDATRTTPDNIELLCPNCHSLTKTYGSLNRGNGRIGRRARYKKQRQALSNIK